MSCKGYTGYLLTAESRAKLLAACPPCLSETIAHHITYDFGVSEQLPPDVTEVVVTDVASNQFAQAAVVKINGNMNRPKGGVFHVTISVDPTVGGRPVMSNDMLVDLSNWTTLDEPFTLEVEPRFFPFGG